MDSSNPYRSPDLSADADELRDFHWTRLLAPTASVATVTGLAWVGLLALLGPPLVRWNGTIPTIVGVPCAAAIISSTVSGKHLKQTYRWALVVCHGLAISTTPMVILYGYYQLTIGQNLTDERDWFLTSAIGFGCTVIDLAIGLLVGRLGKDKS